MRCRVFVSMLVAVLICPGLPAAGSGRPQNGGLSPAGNPIVFDFENAPIHSPLPLDLTVGGLTAHFAGNYSIQPANIMGFTPAGFSGLCIYPNGVFLADLTIGFSLNLTSFSILYAPDELGCDTSAVMRVTAYLNGAFVATATTNASPPGTWPTGTLSISSSSPFNSVVVHWQSMPPGCSDYGPIFMADNAAATLDSQSGVAEAALPVTARLSAPAPNPFQRSTSVRFELPSAGPVNLRVYDVAGRLVRTLIDRPVEAGSHAATWNGTDDRGRPVPASLYVLRLEAAGIQDSRRVVLAR